MKKALRFLALVVLTTTLFSCSDRYEIVGTWEDKEVEKGITVYMEFEKNDSFLIALCPEDKNDVGCIVRGTWTVESGEVHLNYNNESFQLYGKRMINMHNPKKQDMLKLAKSQFESVMINDNVLVKKLSDDKNHLELSNDRVTFNFNRIDSMPERLEAPLYLNNQLFKGEIAKQNVEMFLTVEDPEPGKDYAEISGRYHYLKFGKNAPYLLLKGEYYEDQDGRIDMYEVTEKGLRLTGSYEGTLVKNPDGKYVLSGSMTNSKWNTYSYLLTSVDDDNNE